MRDTHALIAHLTSQQWRQRDDDAVIDLLAESIAAQAAGRSDTIYETGLALRDPARGTDLWAV